MMDGQSLESSIDAASSSPAQRMNETGHSELELVELFRKGDRDAFTTLYRAHNGAVFRFGYHMTGDQAKAADLTQDVFVWFIHHPQAFTADRGDLSAFLLGVARKLMQRRWRDERRWIPLDDAVKQNQLREQDGQTDSHERAINSGLLRQAISVLPNKYREVVVLCDLMGKSYAEAAVSLNCAVGTVRSRLHRSRELLTRKLRPQAGNKR